jgi:hypothetical protein
VAVTRCTWTSYLPEHMGHPSGCSFLVICVCSYFFCLYFFFIFSGNLKLWQCLVYSNSSNIYKHKIIYYWKGTFLFRLKWHRTVSILHSRHRNMCISLCADLHLINLKPIPVCICDHGFEDCIHFFFECPFCNENKAILFSWLENYVLAIELAGDDNLTLEQNIEIVPAQHCLFIY